MRLPFAIQSILAILPVFGTAFLYQPGIVDMTHDATEQIVDDAAPGAHLIDPMKPFPSLLKHDPLVPSRIGELPNPFGRAGAADQAASVEFDLGPAAQGLVEIRDGQALIKLPDHAVYLVSPGDELWGGMIRILSIDRAGVRIETLSDGKSATHLLEPSRY